MNSLMNVITMTTKNVGYVGFVPDVFTVLISIMKNRREKNLDNKSPKSRVSV
jgi:hypothetical protein